MSDQTAPPTDSLVSRDGVLIGPILGIHRDPASRTALWAVVDAGQRRLVVPLQGAESEPGAMRVTHDANRVWSSPPVADPTQLLASDEAALARHYGRGRAQRRPSPSPGAVPQPGVAEGSTGEGGAASSFGAEPAEPGLSMVRSEEQLAVESLEWRPYQRVRLRTVVRSRQETHVVQVRWEELVVESEPVSAVERLEVTSGLTPADTSDVELVLHREEVTVTTRVVPYEWVRATRAPVVEQLQVTDTVRKEMIDVQHERVERNGSNADARRGDRS